MACWCFTLNARNMNWSEKKIHYTTLVCTERFMCFRCTFLNACYVQTQPQDFYIFVHEMLCY